MYAMRPVVVHSWLKINKFKYNSICLLPSMPSNYDIKKSHK